ncbi:MAG TPA: DUF4190 domain-containing protein [Gemmataceae bacterium]|jgi:hypothetical protein|nr:DUF4190 domain-containing protein [Gemmataceae bacterium]
MSLSLTCSCGAHFEVADAFAGQSVACPECQQSLRVPMAARTRLRTSGYALSSVVLTLVGMFTVILTALAVVLGFMALVSISRHRNQVTGAGYAVFGIVLGLIFTGVSLFALSRDELFDRFREKIHANEADYSGPMEIIRAGEGFAITRPTPKWGVARETVGEGAALLLVDVGKNAYLQVQPAAIEWGKGLDQCLDEYLKALRETPGVVAINGKHRPAKTSRVRVHESRRLPPVKGMEILEVRVDLRVAGQPFSYLVWACRKNGAAPAFVVSAWAPSRRLAQLEPELRRGLDSFRILH